MSSVVSMSVVVVAENVRIASKIKIFKVLFANSDSGTMVRFGTTKINSFILVIISASSESALPVTGPWPAAGRRRWGAAVASCPLRRGGGFLSDAARRWLLARCGAAVASCRWLRCHLLSNVVRTDSEGWGVR